MAGQSAENLHFVRKPITHARLQKSTQQAKRTMLQQYSQCNKQNHVVPNRTILNILWVNIDLAGPSCLPWERPMLRGRPRGNWCPRAWFMTARQSLARYGNLRKHTSPTEPTF